MAFHLEDRDLSWINRAPIQLTREIELCADPTQVFAVLSDHSNWPRWFKKMRRVRIDGAASGIGALRTVWVGAATVQERFVRWDENQRLTFNIVRSNLPGMAAMTEEWTLRDSGEGRTLLKIDIAVEPIRVLAPLATVLRAVVASSTSGAAGISSLFPCEGSASSVA